MAGFYRSGYKDSSGNETHMLVTQFEATQCRRAFPCWDEPNLKATFDVTLIIPRHLTALSNMSMVEESLVEYKGAPLKSVKFASSPVMSTYLLAFAVGDFEFVEAWSNPSSPADAKPILCRVYTSPGQKETGRFALDVCVKILAFFSEYFGVAYPLPKMDQLAVPDFDAGIPIPS
jgi:aminopeptidase 2